MLRQRSERLSKNAMFTLIKAVKSRELLWNPKHDDYKIKYMIADAWKEISAEMDIPVDILRMKWKNIRDVYIKEFKKEKDPSAKYRSQWKYYRSMAFLPLFIGEQGESGGTTAKDTEADKAGSESDTELSESEEDQMYEDTAPSEVKVEIEDMSIQPPHKAHEIYFQNDYDIPTTSSASATSAVPNRKRKNPCDDEDDYDMMYLKSLYPYFKQLDPIRKLVVRSRIQDIFLKEMACVVAATKNS